MRIGRLMGILLLLLASAYSQGLPDYYIASLDMPCYPPLARQARVEGQTKVSLQVGKDGAVTSAEAVEGNPLLKAASLANSQTWKFGGGPGADLSQLKTTVIFDYKLEGEPSWERCAARVVFESFNHVEIIGYPAPVMTNDNSSRRR
jgi:TonB family protein